MPPSSPRWLPRPSFVGISAGSIARAVDATLALVFPASCAVCGGEGSFLHEGCERALPRLEMPFCSLCADPGPDSPCSWCAETSPAFASVSAPYLMDGPVRELVYGLKYRNLRAMVPDLGRLLAGYLLANPIEADVAAPVPLHRRRERARGYNQSALLAGELSRLTGIPLEVDLLRKTSNTAPQVSLSTTQERRRNVEGAFECSRGVDGLRVILIDDVVTTGSTMSACAEALTSAGAASVRGLALARQA